MYSETIDEVNKLRVITTTSCPNHFSVCQLGVCAGSRVTKSKKDTKIYSVPLFPRLAKETSRRDAICRSKPVGVAVNGVPFHSMMNELETETCLSWDDFQKNYPGVGISSLKRCNINGIGDGTRYCGDSVPAHGSMFDKCGGHADSNGSYHYHTAPICLLQQLTSQRAISIASNPEAVSVMVSGKNLSLSKLGDEHHSPQVGWALDGFPMYVSHAGPKGVTMMRCGQTGAHPEVCLDECNGYHGALPEIDTYAYRYYVTGPLATGKCSSNTTNAHNLGENGGGAIATADTCKKVDDPCCLSSVPTAVSQPYTIGCFKGCLNDDKSCVYDNERGSSKKFNKLDKILTPDGVYFGGYNIKDKDDTSSSPLSAQIEIDSVSNIDIPIIKDTRNVAYRFPNNGSLALFSHGSDGVPHVETLPESQEDCYLSALVVDQNKIDESLSDTYAYFTTQKKIMKIKTSSIEGSTAQGVIQGSLLVKLYGFNLGVKEDGSDVVVTVDGHQCTSQTRFSSKSLQCYVITMAKPYTEAVADAVTVTAWVTDSTTGITAHPELASVSGRPIIANVTFTPQEFKPYALGISPRTDNDDKIDFNTWLYWSSLGGGNAYNTAGIFRSKRDATTHEVVCQGPLATPASVQQVTSMVIFRPDTSSNLEDIIRNTKHNDVDIVGKNPVELIIYSDVRTGAVSFICISISPRTGGHQSIGLVHYQLLRSPGVVGLSLDHKYGKYCRLLITLKNGNILLMDLTKAIPAAISAWNSTSLIKAAVDAYTSHKTWPSFISRLVSLSSRVRLGGVSALSGSSADKFALQSWSSQRLFFTDINHQRIHAVSESGAPLITFDVGRNYGGQSIVWPFQIAALWTPSSDSSYPYEPSMTLLVAEYLGKIWRFEFKLSNTTGYINETSYLIHQPTLLVDMSNYAASRLLRSSISYDISKGGNPTTFFEAYG
jgi:hypothetical protein